MRLCRRLYRALPQAPRDEPRRQAAAGLIRRRAPAPSRSQKPRRTQSRAWRCCRSSPGRVLSSGNLAVAGRSPAVVSSDRSVAPRLQRPAAPAPDRDPLPLAVGDELAPLARQVDRAQPGEASLGRRRLFPPIRNFILLRERCSPSEGSLEPEEGVTSCLARCERPTCTAARCGGAVAPRDRSSC